VVNTVEVVKSVKHYYVSEHGEALVRRPTVKQKHANNVSHTLRISYIRSKLTECYQDFTKALRKTVHLFE